MVQKGTADAKAAAAALQKEKDNTAQLARDARAQRRHAIIESGSEAGSASDGGEEDSGESSDSEDGGAEEAEEDGDDAEQDEVDEDDAEDEDGAGDEDEDDRGATLLGIFGIRHQARAKTLSRPNPFTKHEDEPYSKYSRVEHDYFWKLDEGARQTVTESERNVRMLACDDIPMRFRILSSDIHPSIKAMALKKLDGIRGAGSGESTKSQQFVDALVRLPIGKYASLPVGPTTPNSVVRAFLNSMQTRLDERVYGHVEAKAHIMRLVAQYAMNPEARGLVIGFHGKVGCGKTELAKAVCECLDLPFGFIALGGSNDSSTLAGHSYTYEGSTWGKIADVLMRCECMNPVFFFDELDKVSDSSGGRQVTNLLVHLTDPTQNDKHTDAYFMGLDLDVSRSIVMFSYNDVDNVNPVLRDRIVEVATDGYRSIEKVAIAQKHLIPQVRRDFGMDIGDLIFDDAVIRLIIDVVVEEAGVRGLKKGIRDIAGSINLKRIMEDDNVLLQAPTTITRAMAYSYVKSGRRDAEQGKRASHSMYT